MGVGFESHPCDNMANMKCVPKTPSTFTFLCEKTPVIYLLAFLWIPPCTGSWCACRMERKQIFVSTKTFKVMKMPNTEFFFLRPLLKWLCSIRDTRNTYIVCYSLPRTYNIWGINENTLHLKYIYVWNIFQNLIIFWNIFQRQISSSSPYHPST